MIETIINFIILFSMFLLNIYFARKGNADICLFMIIFMPISIGLSFQYDYFAMYTQILIMILAIDIYCNIVCITNVKRSKK